MTQARPKVQVKNEVLVKKVVELDYLRFSIALVDCVKVLKLNGQTACPT